ncbi:hypothetical protein TEU_00845 [Thermococcus eurythermalis]|uniref:Uncharacterized protein n=1 Tax=Thermococcus eurythermalis TaxID=1505907 RepID=A0A097QRA0_9EURY|nr:hypothetical protein [Thermococcus eurythermalis]AIU69001.1 hypothetical protein TEU_00845 [Thermococcus eurythermalis]
MKKLIPVAVLTLAVVLVAHTQLQSDGLEKYIGDLNRTLDYAAVVRRNMEQNNLTTLILKEGNQYIVIEEPNAHGIWSLYNGSEKVIRWKICVEGFQNNGTDSNPGPVAFMSYLYLVLNGSPKYEREITWGNPIKVTLVRKPGVPPYENLTINDTKYGPQTFQAPVNDWIRANLTVSEGKLKRITMLSKYPDYFNQTLNTVSVDIKIIYRGEKGYDNMKKHVLERYTELLRACSPEAPKN